MRTPGSPALASGVDAANDKLIFVPPGSVVSLVIPDLTSSESITVSEKHFMDQFTALCRYCSPPEHVTLFEGDAGTLRSLSSKVLSLLNAPGEGIHPEEISKLWVDAFSWIGRASEHIPHEEIRTQHVARHVARQAEEYILENYHSNVHVGDICKVTGVGLRTLQRCVRQYFNVTVTEFLESTRLASAHQELSDLNPSETTVTRVALDSGFSHLGRFSSLYRQRYGVNPSEQLARRPGQKS